MLWSVTDMPLQPGPEAIAPRTGPPMGARDANRRLRRPPAALPDDEVTHILRHARGRYGTTLQYLTDTATALRARGVHDREIERLMTLAQQQGLL